MPHSDCRSRCRRQSASVLSVAAACAIDHLVHHATIVEMNVESYRARAALDPKRGAGRATIFPSLSAAAANLIAAAVSSRLSRHISETNAISPWDFEVVELDGTTVRVEVKSTSGGFDRAIHISHSEVLAAAETRGPRTDLYRVSALSEDGGWLRVSRDIAVLCRTVAASVTALGAGITPDSYNVSVDRISGWSEAERLTYDEADEDDD